MRALADPSARWRSWIGAILDRSGNLCLRTAMTLYDWRNRVAPTLVDDELTPEDADRISAGVQARIAEPTPFAESFTLPPGTFISRFQGFH